MGYKTTIVLGRGFVEAGLHDLPAEWIQIRDKELP